MTPIADMVAQMLAAGVDHAVIVLAVRTAEATAVRGIPVDKVDNSAERRRAYDRDRKRKVRGIPPENPRNSADTNSALSFKEKEKRSSSSKERKRGERIPPDWSPTPDHLAEALALGHDDAWMFGQAEDMRIWAKTNDHRAVARKSDWNLTFTGWMRRTARAGPQRSGLVPRPGSREDTRERTVNALDKLTNYVAANTDDASGSGSSREANAGLLPFAKSARS